MVVLALICGVVDVVVEAGVGRGVVVVSAGRTIVALEEVAVPGVVVDTIANLSRLHSGTASNFKRCNLLLLSKFYTSLYFYKRHSLANNNVSIVIFPKFGPFTNYES